MGSDAQTYRGRIAPTPTGELHLGHARTFYTAYQRAKSASGTLIYRDEDLDRQRCRPEYSIRAMEDLRWLGIDWTEGPDLGGPFASYRQSERTDWYLEIWRRLAELGAIYPSVHSRRDVEHSQLAPHEGDEEPMFPPHLRPPLGEGRGADNPGEVNWRFRVPDGQTLTFHDQRLGPVERFAGTDFGDFIVWRRDGAAAYELAVVADDHAMRITEVVRGEDLLTSTARQLLIYEALGWNPPEFFHCPMVRDADGRRLAKRTQALSLRELRSRGTPPAEIISCNASN